MSYSNFEKATKLVEQCQFYKTAGRQTEELIKKVEEALGFKMSKQHHEYLKNYGYIMFLGTEIYGIYDKVFEGIYAGNAVIATLQDREEYNLPKAWIPVFDYDDGYVAYLDYGNLNLENEPRVILSIFTGRKYEVGEIIADDFGDFLLQLVEQQIGKQ